MEFLHKVVGATFARDEIIKEFEDVEGFLRPDEGYALFLISLFGPGAGAVVEIGSFMGRSTCFLAEGAKRGNRDKIIAIDHFRGSPEHQSGATHEVQEIVKAGSTYGRFCQNLARAELLGHVDAIRASTETAAQTWNRKIRLLFIDGDHDYDATKRDFDLFSPYVEPEGIICFHDVGIWPGVTQFTDELSGKRWRQLFRVYALAAFVRC